MGYVSAIEASAQRQQVIDPYYAQQPRIGSGAIPATVPRESGPSVDPRYPAPVYRSRIHDHYSLSDGFYQSMERVMTQPYFGYYGSREAARDVATVSRGLKTIHQQAPAARVAPAARPAVAAPARPPPVTGPINPWEAIAHPSFSAYLDAVHQGYDRGWLSFRDGR